LSAPGRDLKIVAKPLEQICKIVSDIFGFGRIATMTQRVGGFEHERPSLFAIEDILIDERSQRQDELVPYDSAHFEASDNGSARVQATEWAMKFRPLFDEATWLQVTQDGRGVYSKQWGKF
jgi:hypothetical protein